MNQLPFDIQQAIRQYKPIFAEGLTLYPVRVRDFALFQAARPALEVLQTSFPVAYLSMPLLQVFFRMDFIEPLTGQGKGTGLWASAMLALALSLRLGDGLSPEERVLRFFPIPSDRDMQRLRCVRADAEDGKTIEITPVQFQRLRPIIAAQNGVRLEDENADPELVRAWNEMRQSGAAALDATLDQTIASVCALTGAEEEAVEDWPIRKLNLRASSLQRAMDYMVCGIGGAFGGFGKGGNPVPHPFYEKLSRDGLFTDLASYAGGAGARALANAGEVTA